MGKPNNANKKPENGKKGRNRPQRNPYSQQTQSTSITDSFPEMFKFMAQSGMLPIGMSPGNRGGYLNPAMTAESVQQKDQDRLANIQNNWNVNAQIAETEREGRRAYGQQRQAHDDAFVRGMADKLGDSYKQQWADMNPESVQRVFPGASYGQGPKVPDEVGEDYGRDLPNPKGVAASDSNFQPEPSFNSGGIPFQLGERHGQNIQNLDQDLTKFGDNLGGVLDNWWEQIKPQAWVQAPNEETPGGILNPQSWNFKQPGGIYEQFGFGGGGGQAAPQAPVMPQQAASTMPEPQFDQPITMYVDPATGQMVKIPTRELNADIRLMNAKAKGSLSRPPDPTINPDGSLPELQPLQPMGITGQNPQLLQRPQFNPPQTSRGKINGMDSRDAIEQAFSQAEIAGMLDSSIERKAYPWSNYPHKPVVRRTPYWFSDQDEQRLNQIRPLHNNIR